MEKKTPDESICDLEFEVLENGNESPPAKGRSFVELLVDPRTLQGLMLSGGGLLVVGLVVWLWSIGVFENAKLVAGCLGVGNVALLAAGMGLVLRTSHQTAGKAVTLLACLVMPLQLWFYDAQGLITLANGGHLWMPALVCCAIYVAVARVLADSTFVYTIVGGITMTGMLFLADSQVGRLWEIMAPSTFLVVLGIICIHIERAFAPGKGDFSREKFGLAFFRAGHVVLASGLVLLLGGRLAGWLYEPFLADFSWFTLPAVATQANLKLLAIALTLAATYSYVYSQVVVKARGNYAISAMLTLLWCAVILIDLLAIPFTLQLVALLVAIAGLLANLIVPLGRQEPNVEESQDKQDRLDTFIAPFLQAAPKVAAGMNGLLVLLATVLFAQARFGLFQQWMQYEFTEIYVTTMLLGGLSYWLSFRRSKSVTSLQSNLLGVGLMATFATAATIACLGFEFSLATLTVEMLVPFALASYSLVAKPIANRAQWSRAAEWTTSILLLQVPCVLIWVLAPASITTVGLIGLFSVAATSYALASVRASRITPALLSAGCICVVVWQLLILAGVTQHVLILATTLVGVISLIASRFMPTNLTQHAKLSLVSQYVAQGCITLSGAAALLMAFGRLMVGETAWSIIGVLAVQFCAASLGALLTKDANWRRTFVMLAAAEVLLGMLVVNALSTLSFIQRMELLITSVGMLMVSSGYYGWYRETDRREDWVSFNLAFGSLLAAVPVTIGLLVQRFGVTEPTGVMAVLHESGTLLVGLCLLAAGIMCRIRWSTLVGGSTLVLYIVSLVGMIQLPEQLQTTAIYMMVGGGTLFGITLLLSMYRDRLLTLPKRMQDGEGVFRVLKWR